MALPTKETYQKATRKVVWLFGLWLVFACASFGTFVFGMASLFVEQVGRGLGFIFISLIVGFIWLVLIGTALRTAARRFLTIKENYEKWEAAKAVKKPDAEPT